MYEKVQALPTILASAMQLDLSEFKGQQHYSSYEIAFHLTKRTSLPKRAKKYSRPRLSKGPYAPPQIRSVGRGARTCGARVHARESLAAWPFCRVCRERARCQLGCSLRAERLLNCLE